MRISVLSTNCFAYSSIVPERYLLLAGPLLPRPADAMFAIVGLLRYYYSMRFDRRKVNGASIYIYFIDTLQSEVISVKIGCGSSKVFSDRTGGQSPNLIS